jgi:hypothetical protein
MTSPSTALVAADISGFDAKLAEDGIVSIRIIL